jgi:hypothetical protein
MTPQLANQTVNLVAMLPWAGATPATLKIKTPDMLSSFVSIFLTSCF